MSQSSAGTPVRLAIEIPMQPLPVQISKRNLTGAVVFFRSAIIFPLLRQAFPCPHAESARFRSP